MGMRFMFTLVAAAAASGCGLGDLHHSVGWQPDSACEDWTPEWDDAMRKAEVHWAEMGVAVAFGATGAALQVSVCLTAGPPAEGDAGHIWTDGDEARIGVNATLIAHSWNGAPAAVLTHELGHAILPGNSSQDHLPDGELGMMSATLGAVEWTSDDVRHLENLGLAYRRPSADHRPSN